jgi:hypothetical protein
MAASISDSGAVVCFTTLHVARKCAILVAQTPLQLLSRNKSNFKVALY